MEEILPAIIAATTIVSIVTVLIFASEIPKMEEGYRKKHSDKLTEDESTDE